MYQLILLFKVTFESHVSADLTVQGNFESHVSADLTVQGNY